MALNRAMYPHPLHPNMTAGYELLKINFLSQGTTETNSSTRVQSLWPDTGHLLVAPNCRSFSSIFFGSNLRCESMVAKVRLPYMNSGCSYNWNYRSILKCIYQSVGDKRGCD